MSTSFEIGPGNIGVLWEPFYRFLSLLFVYFLPRFDETLQNFFGAFDSFSDLANSFIGFFEKRSVEMCIIKSKIPSCMQLPHFSVFVRTLRPPQLIVRTSFCPQPCLHRQPGILPWLLSNIVFIENLLFCMYTQTQHLQLNFP